MVGQGLADAVMDQRQRRDLGPDIALGLVGRAHIGADQGDEAGIRRAIAQQPHGRDMEAFLEELPRLGLRIRPPISGTWLVVAPKATMRPPRKTGRTNEMSLRCPVPIQGLLVM